MSDSKDYNENQDIDDILNSEMSNHSDQNVSDDENNHLNINDDTETMNNQISNRINNKSDLNDDGPKRIIKIDKNQLKSLIIEWLALDDIGKALKDKMKEVADEKKQFESQILELMNALKQEVILTDRGNITRTVRESKGPITPELIKTTLTEILKCHETADTYTNHIMEKRIVKENVALKRKDVDDHKKNKAVGKNKNFKGTGRQKKKNTLDI